MNKNEFLKLYSNLPISIQDFLASDKMGIIIDDALNFSKISSEKFSDIMDIVTEILSFQLPKDQFRDELEKRINISSVAAQIVDKVIQERIFKIFEQELSQYKSQRLEQVVSQETLEKEQINNLAPQKITPTIEGKIEQVSSEQMIPEYSFPEPSEVKIEKPMSKIEELKKVVTPTISSEKQEKIRENLLAAMQKKEAQPKILEEIKKVLLKPLKSKEKEVPEKKKTEELTSSKILSGEGKKFEDEEVFVKTKEEKPYILDVKLKEEKQKEKESSTIQEPIPYRKYQKKNPFGEA